MGRAWRSSSRASTRSPEAGLAISSTAITRPFRIWIPGSGCGCAAFCVSVRSGAVGAEGAIISAGPMLSLPRRGCSLLHKPRRRCVNPLGGEPPTGEPDAGEPPVRFGGREERIQSPLPTPIEKNGTKTQLDCHCPGRLVGRFHGHPGRLVVDLWSASARSDQSIESRRGGSTSSALSNAALGRWHSDCFADRWRDGLVLLRQARAETSRASRRVLCGVHA